MTERDHEAWREQLGALVLGQLGAEEEASVRAHLAGCPRCRAEYADLAPLAVALRDVDPAQIGSEPPPPAFLGERIAQVLAGERERHTRGRTRRLGFVGAISAAAAGLAVAAGLVFLPGSDPAPVPEGPREPIEVVELEAGVDAEGALIAHTWGTELVLTATGLEDGAVYQVAFETTDGRRVPSAGSFIGDSTRPVVCRLNAAILREDVDGLIVTKGSDLVLTSEL